MPPPWAERGASKQNFRSWRKWFYRGLGTRFSYAQQLVQMQQESLPLGVTHWIVFPFVSYAAMDVSKFRSRRIAFGNGLETIPYAFENRRLLEECFRLFPNEGRRTLPFVMVDPMRDTEAQAKELVKLRTEFRFHGIKIQSTIIQSDIKRLAHEGQVFLDLAREWDIPFLIHSSVAAGDPWAQAHDILDIAASNLDIRFCAAHSCRYDKRCLDRVNRMKTRYVYLLVLIDHKSSADALTVIQMLGYIVRILENAIENEKPLAPVVPWVIPWVIYNGVRRWGATRSLHELIPVPESWKRLELPILDRRRNLEELQAITESLQKQIENRQAE